MKQRLESCKYCSKKLEDGTTRKEFCSPKCRVYWNREHPKVTLKNFNEQSKGTTKLPEKKAAKNESIDISNMPDPKKDRAAFAKWMRDKNV